MYKVKTTQKMYKKVFEHIFRTKKLLKKNYFFYYKTCRLFTQMFNFLFFNLKTNKKKT